MTSCLEIVGGRKGCRRANFAGKMIIIASRMASAPHDRRMPRRGNRPMGVSPASAAGERPQAGPIAVRNSCHGDDHSTSNLGPSVMPGRALLRYEYRFQADLQL